MPPKSFTKMVQQASRQHFTLKEKREVHQGKESFFLAIFEAIGINPDLRRENNNLGYKVTFLILDYLETSKELNLFCMYY